MYTYIYVELEARRKKKKDQRNWRSMAFPIVIQEFGAFGSSYEILLLLIQGFEKKVDSGCA